MDLPFADRVFTELGAAELRAAGPRTHAVVATMGEHDEDAIAAALLARPAYLGVVASRKRYAQLRDALLARGVAPAALDGIVCPAGLDLGGRGPEEVALSIVAEIVQLRRRPAAVEEVPRGEEATDPVCHMTVAVATARHLGEWDGRTWYFCNARCRERFLAEPGRFLGPTLAAAGEAR